MALDYIIRSDRENEWLQGQAVSLSLLDITQQIAGVRYFPVHGDPILDQLDDHDLSKPRSSSSHLHTIRLAPAQTGQHGQARAINRPQVDQVVASE